MQSNAEICRGGKACGVEWRLEQLTTNSSHPPNELRDIQVEGITHILRIMRIGAHK
jgi:hypothetical protein